MTSVAGAGLEGRRILVTGAGRGLGRAVAEHLLASGARVAGVDLDLASLRAWAPDAAHVARCDVADETSVRTAVDAAADALGGLDGVVSNAARVAVTRAPAGEIDVKEFDDVLAVNVRGPWLVYRAAHPWLVAAGGGAVVNLSSETAFSGSQNLSHYVASKAAVVGLTRALAREGGLGGIRVNAVAPGFTDTEGARGIGDPDTYDTSATPLRRVGQPDDVVGAVAFLLTDGAAFVSGQVLLVNGGRVCH
jgi:NAD(P)-dependent dehydrogenase (short-subunit alcohol dehydrogenase family)